MKINSIHIEEYLTEKISSITGIPTRDIDRSKPIRELGVYAKAIACVVIRSTIAGGDGSFIAKELLEKKISLDEQITGREEAGQTIHREKGNKSMEHIVQSMIKAGLPIPQVTAITGICEKDVVYLAYKGQENVFSC